MSKELLVMEEIVRRWRSDIKEFSRGLCGDMVHSDVPAFHVDIYDMITSGDNCVIAAPRGFAKSMCVSRVFIAWCALFRIKRDIMIVSASESLAVEHLRYIKQMIEGNEVVRAVWGDLRSDKWTENHISLKFNNGDIVHIRARGAGGQIRGYRPDLVVVDDLETDDSVASEDQRKKIKDWLFKACFNCLLPGGQMVVVGTVLSQLSVLNDLLIEENGWCKRRLTAYVDGVEQDGHELWPEQRPHAWLQERKALIGTHRFAAEYMNNPMADDAAVVGSDDIRVYDGLPELMNLYMCLDPAYSEDPKSDWKVCVLVGLDSNMNRYLIRYVRTHAPTHEYVDSVLGMWLSEKARVLGIGVPNSGTEKEFFRTFINRASSQGHYPPVVELKNTFRTATGSNVRAKKDRITAALQPLFKSGKYFIGKDHYEARDELLTIGYSRWDDIVDAMAGCENVIQPTFSEFHTGNDGVYEKVEENDRYISDYGIVY